MLILTYNIADIKKILALGMDEKTERVISNSEASAQKSKNLDG